VGARLDVLDYEDPLNATTRDATSFNPLLGLVYSSVAKLALHASWATGSAPFSTQVVGPREPEESRQLEVGGKLKFLGGGPRQPGHHPSATVCDPDLSDQPTGGRPELRGIEADVSAEPVRS
jgi:outer membrane receptor protein involved in Fe transport